jgi:hypothetical protein
MIFKFLPPFSIFLRVVELHQHHGTGFGRKKILEGIFGIKEQMGVGFSGRRESHGRWLHRTLATGEGQKSETNRRKKGRVEWKF